MKIKKSKGERAFQVFNYAFLMLIMLVCLYPVWYVAVASFSNSNALTQHSGLLFRPIGFSMDAYKKVFQNPMIGKGYLNPCRRIFGSGDDFSGCLFPFQKTCHV